MPRNLIFFVLFLEIKKKESLGYSNIRMKMKFCSDKVNNEFGQVYRQLIYTSFTIFSDKPAESQNMYHIRGTGDISIKITQLRLSFINLF